MKYTNLLAAAILALPLSLQAAVVDFEDLSLPAESYFDPNATTTFSSGGMVFQHDAPFGACCWSGFTYSNSTDNATAGYSNDYSAYPGSGYAGSSNYAVAYSDGAQVNFASTVLSGAYFANTTYAYLAMANGDDGNQTPFVKGPFGEGDFFEITVDGLNASGEVSSSVSFLLADGANVIEDWLWVDLSGLGAVSGLQFSFASSDNGDWGVNTPTYFAIDNITAVPLPAGVWLFGSALLSLIGLRQRQQA